MLMPIRYFLFIDGVDTKKVRKSRLKERAQGAEAIMALILLTINTTADGGRWGTGGCLLG